MTFKQYYTEILKNTEGFEVKESFVRILWEEAFTIEQAIHTIKTSDEK
jgi:hypothetical protein